MQVQSYLIPGTRKLNRKSSKLRPRNWPGTHLWLFKLPLALNGFLFLQVVYDLAGDDGDEELFSLRTQGGEAVLQLKGLLDYEEKSIYQLKVRNDSSSD